MEPYFTFNQRIDLETFFEQSPDFICTASSDGYFKKVNPVMAHTLGYSNEELLTKPIISFVHIEDRRCTNIRALETPSAILNNQSSYLTKHGDIVQVNWTSTELDNKQLILAIGKQTASSTHSRNKLIPSVTVPADRVWLSKFEKIVRDYSGRQIDLNLMILSDELAISERQLYRRTKAVLNMSPNQFICKVRLQLAMEAIETGQFRTISEISHAAGFQSANYFKKMFNRNFNVDIKDLL